MSSGQSISKIIHVDMDSFYASVEQRDNPEWKGKPVIVGGPPNSRSVVCTASYEARKFGVHSAMACSKAFVLCPQGIFTPPRFSVYKEISHQIREIFYEYTDFVEPLSLDEAYLDVTQNKWNIEMATTIAKEIKQKIWEKTKLTASAGVASGKFLAKIASGMNKPNGLTVILPKDAEKFLESLPIGKFYGIGKVTENKLLNLGIKTGLDLKERSEAELTRIFGKQGIYYYNLIRGKDFSKVNAERERKSIGAEETFSQDIDDKEALKKKLWEILEDVEKRALQNQIKGKTITIKIKFFDFETITRSTTLQKFTNEKKDLSDSVFSLFDNCSITKKVRLLGVSLSNFEKQDFSQLDLFSGIG